eukprot:1007827_1
MSTRKRTKQSYKECKVPRTTKKDKIIEKVNWLRFDQPQNTIYTNHPKLNDKRLDEIPEHILGFELNQFATKKHKFIVMNTVNGNIKLNDMCVNIKDLHEEEYFTGIKGHEEGLIAIGMWSSSFLQRNKIQNPLEIFSRKIGDEVSINCKGSQTIVAGSITKKRLPRYWKEMIAPYYFESSLRKDKKYNQWVFESQINETGEYKDITFKDEIKYRMLKCIESGSDAYIKSTYIESNELPLYLNITTPYFGNKDAYLKFDPIINNPDHYRPKIITYEYMKKAVVKGIS